jgi:hypothetical protein
MKSSIRQTRWWYQIVFAALGLALLWGLTQRVPSAFTYVVAAIFVIVVLLLVRQSRRNRTAQQSTAPIVLEDDVTVQQATGAIVRQRLVIREDAIELVGPSPLAMPWRALASTCTMEMCVKRFMPKSWSPRECITISDGRDWGLSFYSNSRPLSELWATLLTIGVRPSGG